MTQPARDCNERGLCHRWEAAPTGAAFCRDCGMVAANLEQRYRAQRALLRVIHERMTDGRDAMDRESMTETAGEIARVLA